MKFVTADIEVMGFDNLRCYDLKIHFSELSQALIEILNLLYSKKQKIIFCDSLKKVSIIIDKDECDKLNFLNRISLTINSLECLIAMILDYLNGKASMNQHLDFELIDGKTLSIISFSVSWDN